MPISITECRSEVKTKMSDTLLNGLLTFLSICVAAITIQNTVFARALGVSRLISLVDDTPSTAIFGVELTAVMVLGSIFNYFANAYLIKNSALVSYLRPLAMILCMSLAYLIVFVLKVKFAPYDKVTKAADTLPLATFNCVSAGTLMVSVSTQYDLFETICFSFAAAIGYVLAVVLVTEGQRKIQSVKTPVAFRGLPVTLLYLAGLAMAIYGLTGFTFSF